MAQEWFIIRGGKEYGPYTSQQLRDMAANGQVVPDDLVRRRDTQKQSPAKLIKGLPFPNVGNAAPKPPPPAVAEGQGSSTATPASQEKTVALSVMAQEWYINRNGKSQGPHSAQQLNQMTATGNLLPSDLVWKQGMAQWMPASKIEGFFSSAEPIAAVPLPPPIEQPKTPESNSKQASAFKEELEKEKQTPPVLTPPLNPMPQPADEKDGQQSSPAKEKTFSELLAELRKAPVSEQRGVASMLGLMVGIVFWILFGGFFGMLITGVVLALVLDFGSEKLNLKIRFVDSPPKFFAIIICGMIYMVYMDAVGDPGGGLISRGGPKLAAMRRLVAKCRQTPGDYASEAEHRRFNEELWKLHREFERIEFDPKKNPSEAKAIIELYRREIEHRYKGEVPRELGGLIRDMHDRLTW